MGKKYMDTKKGSLEQSVLNVWKDAAEMHEEGFDGRTKEYREHRAKLENKRVKREEKKNKPKMEQPETEHGSGEHAYEVGTDRYDEYTRTITPGQITETFFALGEQVDEEGDVEWTDEQERLGEEILDMPEDHFDDLLEEMSEEELLVFEGILGAIGRGIKTGAKRFGTKQGRASAKLAKAKKKQDLVKTKADIKKTKADTKQMKKDANIGVVNKSKTAAKKGVEIGKKVGKKAKEVGGKAKDAIKKSMEEVEEEVELDEAKYLEIDFKDKSTAEKAYNYINNEIWAGGNPPYDDFNQEGNSLQIDHSGDAKDLLDDLKDLPRNMKFKVAVNEAASPDWAEPKNLRDTIVSMWSEAASSAVNPQDREELDMDATDSAKKMKRADEPAPMVATEEVIDEKLSAKQKKLDVDGDGEIEGSDLAKLRKKAKKEGKTELEVAKEFKVASMKEALAKVWGFEEGYGGKKKMKEGGMKRLATGGKDALKGFKPKPKKEGNKADTGEDVAAVELDPKIKEKK
tara:strand:- start:981 stop:2525 length:1545 start_codon:yes stop_codon:yes gene_type:complete